MGSNDTFNIAVAGDTHLGYEAYPYTDSSDINLRAKDGEKAYDAIVNGILNSETRIDAFLHTGDVFHKSHPSIRDIFIQQHYSRLLADHNIPQYIVGGNHDTSDKKSAMSAVSVINDPSKNIHALWKPYGKYEIADGIMLHAVSHHGLSGDEAPEVKAENGMLNIFMTHGAALDPKNNALMNCKDSPREQLIPPELIIDDNFILKALGHYHKFYSVGDESLNTWYPGSTVRRGFADEVSPRGWILFKIHPNGKVDMEFQAIKQRPQFDLTPIDASGLTVEELQHALENNILSTNVDPDSDAFDEDEAPIVRQHIINASRGLRAGLDKRRISQLTRHMLHWDLKYPPMDLQMPTLTNDETSLELGENVIEIPVNEAPSLARSAGKADIVSAFNAWAEQSPILNTLAENEKIIVKTEASEHLEAVRNEE